MGIVAGSLLGLTVIIVLTGALRGGSGKVV
jgi:hypothetical protein